MPQSHFLRKLLQIYPPRAANFFLRLELGRQHIQARILFLAIRYHNKLVLMQNNRFPKIILNELLLQHTNAKQNKQNNWISTYTTLLNTFGSSFNEVQRICQKKDTLALNNLMTKVTDSLINTDLMKAQNSTSYNYYTYPCISHTPPSYTQTTWPTHLKQLNAALRNQSQWISLSRHKKLKLYKYEKCPLCDMSGPYTIYHILMQCVHLNPYRHQGFCSKACFPEENYVMSFMNLTLNHVKEIHKLLCIHVAQIELTVLTPRLWLHNLMYIALVQDSSLNKSM